MSDAESGPVRKLALVSVIVPAYNHERYIESCLESVVQSTYEHLEILVLDDGSSDETYARAISWMERNSARVSHMSVLRQENQGLTRTLNTLVSQASGEFVTVLGSDDGLEPDGIACRVAALQTHAEWLAVFGDCSVIDGEGRQTAESALEELNQAYIPALLDPSRIAPELILRWSVPGPAMLARSIAYDEVSGVGLYDEQLKVEDRDFYLKLLSKDALGFVEDRVARYRLHGANSSILNNPTVTRDMRMAEWQNIQLFNGSNRCLLRLVATRGILSLRAADEIHRGHFVRGQLTRLVGRAVEVLRGWVYFAHRIDSRPKRNHVER